MSEREPIGVIGVGWVGLVTAACFAELGHPVVARDIVAEKVAALSEGRSTIHEPGLDELLARNRERLKFTLEVGEVLDASRLLFVCVDTPPTHSGDADLGRVMSVVGELEGDSSHALVMKSTVPAGTGRKIQQELSGTAYVSCPEFLREGTAIEDFMHPDRVVIGADPGNEWAADAVAEIYGPTGGEMVRTDVASAEMIKLAANTFLATKISFINEIANVCEEVGADVSEVARGMGLDERIGPRFLQAGIGFGGSCLDGEETVLVRQNGRIALACIADLFDRYGEDPSLRAVRPAGLEVLAWSDDADQARFLPVSALTRRWFEGEIVEVKTKMGRRLLATPDHPFVVRSPNEPASQVKLAGQLTESDWLPLALGPWSEDETKIESLNVVSGAEFAGADDEQIIVRPAASEVAELAATRADYRSAALSHPRGSLARVHDITRAGALRLDEAFQLRLSLRDASAGTVRNGTYVPVELPNDEELWRIVGLYIAEGHCTVDGRRHRLSWSFHPTREEHLVEEVRSYWERHGVKATAHRFETSHAVIVSSRLLAAWWLDVLGLGSDCYTQRIPDLAWRLPRSMKEALLSGMWEGDGSWRPINGGPSVALNYGTASPELADGLIRMLGELGIVARMRVGRTAKSTCDNFWIDVSGADQIEKGLFLIPSRDHDRVTGLIGRQKKRIAPTGYRRRNRSAWVRVTETSPRPFRGHVYSLEVPGAETFVTSGGLVAHNCFGKDVSALRKLAANTGYHFQLLNAVVEVNELQKRRVVRKLRQHLGPLAGKEVALLGLSFKPDTDDMRDAASLVLAARLEGEGVRVRGYDPVAEERARELLPQVEMSASAMEALDGAEAAILVTEWPQFAELDWEEAARRMARPLLIDGRNFLDPARLRAAGFSYEGIGRASEPEPETGS